MSVDSGAKAVRAARIKVRLRVLTAVFALYVSEGIVS